MKKILTLCTCLILALSFVGCDTTTTTNEVANVNTPTATAKECNHKWSSATCTLPKKCTLCGVTSGTSLGHNYSSATCTDPQKCSRCGITSGASLGHNYSSATCTDPQKCSRCGIISGTSLGHNYSSGICNRCNVKDPNYVGYSRVKGEFTYKYNNFVGTRGDDGTKVMFIPKKASIKSTAEDTAMMLVKGKYDSGIIVEKCDGYGRFDTGEEYIPAGDYIVVVVSKNTTGSIAGIKVDTLRGYLGNYISDENLETLAIFIGNSKLVIDDMTLQAGYEHSISNHFGVSYT